jgi:hypothetical protein
MHRMCVDRGWWVKDGGQLARRVWSLTSAIVPARTNHKNSHHHVRRRRSYLFIFVPFVFVFAYVAGVGLPMPRAGTWREFFLYRVRLVAILHLSPRLLYVNVVPENWQLDWKTTHTAASIFPIIFSLPSSSIIEIPWCAYLKMFSNCSSRAHISNRARAYLYRFVIRICSDSG